MKHVNLLTKQKQAFHFELNYLLMLVSISVVFVGFSVFSFVQKQRIKSYDQSIRVVETQIREEKKIRNLDAIKTPKEADKLMKSLLWAELLQDIFKVIPAQTSISNIAGDAGKNNSISLKGETQEVHTIAKLQKALQQSERCAEVHINSFASGEIYSFSAECRLQ